MKLMRGFKSICAAIAVLLCCGAARASAADLGQARRLLQVPPPSATAPAAEPAHAASTKPQPTGLPGSGSLGKGVADPVCCAELKAVGFQSNLPVVVIDTHGKDLVGKTKTNATLCTCGAAGLPGGDYDGPVVVLHRGGTNSNARNALQSLTVKLPKANAKAHFVGLQSSNNFILYQPQNDTLGLHEWIGLNLSRSTGEYASPQQFVETFINVHGGPLAYPGDYVGLQLAEHKIERGMKVIDVAKSAATTAPDASGYILEYTHGEASPGDAVINGTTTNTPWNLFYPSQKTASPGQIAYITKALNDFEKALFSPQLTSPTVGWRAFGNETTFADWWLAAELIKNAKHSYHGADYLTKDGPGLLEMGPQTLPREGEGYCCGYPVEGYNDAGVSAPGKAGGSAISPNGWLFDICDDQQRCLKDPTFGLSVWFRQLWQDPKFQLFTAQRFLQLRAGPWSDAAVGGLIDSQQAALMPAALRTLNKYVPLGLIWSPGKYPSATAGYTDTFSQLHTWVLARLTWMNGQLAAVAAGRVPPELVVKPVDLSQSTLASQVLAAGPAPTTAPVAVPAQLAAAG